MSHKQMHKTSGVEYKYSSAEIRYIFANPDWPLLLFNKLNFFQRIFSLFVVELNDTVTEFVLSIFCACKLLPFPVEKPFRSVELIGMFQVNARNCDPIKIHLNHVFYFCSFFAISRKFVEEFFVWFFAKLLSTVN